LRLAPTQPRELAGNGPGSSATSGAAARASLPSAAHLRLISLPERKLNERKGTPVIAVFASVRGGAMTTSQKPLSDMTDAAIEAAIRANEGVVGVGVYAYSVPQLAAERERRTSLRMQRRALVATVAAAIAAIASAVAAFLSLLRGN